MHECNLVLQAASLANSPVAIRITHASGVVAALESHDDDERNDYGSSKTRYSTAVSGAVILALHVQKTALECRVPVILQSETRCFCKLVTWYEDLLAVNEAYFSRYKKPLFSSHQLDLTNDHGSLTDETEYLALAEKYLERMHRSNIWLYLRCGKSESFYQGDMKYQDQESSLDDCVIEKILNDYATLQKISKDFALVVNLNLFQRLESAFRDRHDCSRQSFPFLVIDDDEDWLATKENIYQSDLLVQVNVSSVFMCLSAKSSESVTENIVKAFRLLMEHIQSAGKHNKVGHNTNVHTSQRNILIWPTKQIISVRQQKKVLAMCVLLYFIWHCFLSTDNNKPSKGSFFRKR